MSLTTSRRDFLKGSAALASGLVVGLNTNGSFAASAVKDFIPNPFVKILSDNSVIVIVKHFEMGQGATTGLATLVAEELDADWGQIKTEWAPANAKLYANLAFGSQGTGGSTAIANSFEQYRKAGAAAKQLLIKAAAKTWSVKADEILISNGILKHSSGKSAKLGDMAEAASVLKLDGDVKLKDPKDYKLIGKEDLHRVDHKDKTDGTAQFALDVKLPDMVYAVVARSPRFGGVLKSFDAKDTLKVKGVVDVKQIPQGVVVYAKK